MKKVIILLFSVAVIFAQTEEFEKNLNLGNSDTANYTIVAGDNLWDLAGRFYGDNFEWRFIWEHNRYIEDPHWIFPGNRLFIPALPHGQGFASVPSASDVVPSSDNVRLFDAGKTLNQLSEQTRRAPTIHQISLIDKFRYYFSLEALRQAPFIHKFYENAQENRVDVFAYGEVASSSRPILVQHKEALVIIKNSAKSAARAELTKIGNRLDFYAVRDNLPVARNIKGVIIELAATGVVRSVNGDSVFVFIDRLWGPLGAGAKVAPPREHKQFGARLGYRVLSDSLEVRVIARMTPDVSLKPSEILFIDKGANDGVSVGDHFVFYERSGGSKRNSRQKSATANPLAEGLVIAAENNTATIKITGAREFSSANTFVGVRQGGIVSR